MKKKLIEVALPLEAINKESAREKSIRHGHSSTLHLWWARRPLAACRAVLFASLVDDPSSLPEQFPTEADQDKERQRLFWLIEELVKWDNSSNETVLKAAYNEILKSTGGNPPPIYDPFCGGGSIPLEAQRLGLESQASDLNPVAVLITKALIEIPPRFAGQSPINPAAKAKMSGKGMWTGARGLADDIRYYGQWMRDRAFERIGHLYPKVRLPAHHGDSEATVIAWLWARTVECPNPACGVRMPLARSFVLSTKPGKRAWVEPVVNHTARAVTFKVCTGSGDPPEGTVHRRGARCLVCGTAVTLDYIRSESRSKGLSAQLLAIVAEGVRGRGYITASPEHSAVANSATPVWHPQGEIADNPGHTNVYRYGLTNWSDLFTARQLVALTTFSNLVIEAREEALADGASPAKADAIATYLSFAVDKASDRNTTLCAWEAKMDRMRGTFGRQALPMVWDYIETNPFAGAGGDLAGCVNSLCEALEVLLPRKPGVVRQLDAMSLPTEGQHVVFSTDPPYYDNIGYADLSDFFYVWLRRNLGAIYPEICSTLLVPKKQELVATPYRFGGSKELAQKFFEEGFILLSLSAR